MIIELPYSFNIPFFPLHHIMWLVNGPLTEHFRCANIFVFENPSNVSEYSLKEIHYFDYWEQLSYPKLINYNSKNGWLILTYSSCVQTDGYVHVVSWFSRLTPLCYKDLKLHDYQGANNPYDSYCQSMKNLSLTVSEVKKTFVWTQCFYWIQSVASSERVSKRCYS